MQIQSSSFFAMQRSPWAKPLLFALTAWLGATLVLDVVVMPCLYIAGMMTSSDFASAGYLLFGTINHLEVLGAAFILTAVLALISEGLIRPGDRTTPVMQGLSLLAIALFYTYCLTPAMSALALSLDGDSVVEVGRTMAILQGEYWVLELIKCLVLGLLLGRVNGFFFGTAKPQ